MNKLSDQELQSIVEAAAGLFVEQGIGKTSIRDIAERSGFGEATIYRHFGTKAGIALKVGVYLSDLGLSERFLSDGTLSGFEQIRYFFSAFVQIFESHRNYFKLLYEFDSPEFLLPGENAEYERSLERYHALFLVAYEKGLADGTVRAVPDVGRFYYTATHALLSLCKYLAVSKTPLEADKENAPADEIRTLCELIIHNLSKENPQ